ncbi:hypothetical protein ACN8ZM_40335 (plasmid) [Burkholderia aenigmatica]|uniref:hypothetical protein n=1 Tax=Burkholderia aenigmatica TaxID=2015348 RepID=UPI003B43407A
MLERPRDGETYSVEQASRHAVEFCRKNPAWMRICDIPDSDSYTVKWSELSKRDQEHWCSEFAYNEFARKRSKCKVGFVTGKGEFYDDVLKVPLYHNLMTVFRVGVKRSRQYRSANHAE